MDRHRHNAPSHRNASQPAAVAVHHVSHQTTHHIPICYKPAVRFYTKANKDLSLTIRDGKVVLAPNNPSDHHQHWIMDETFETVKDAFGKPSFALVNKANGQAIKHSTSPGQPIQLVEFNPDKLDVSVLWTKDGVGFHGVRLVNNTRIHLDACIGEHGGVEDGTAVGLWAWTQKANQMWATTFISGVRFYTKANRDYSLTIRDGKVVLAPTNPSDLYQRWIIDDTFSTTMDCVGNPSFALVNKATRQAIKHSTSSGQLIQLVKFNPDKLDVSVLWTWCASGNGAMRVVNNTSLNLGACTRKDGGVEDGTTVALWGWTAEANLMWATAPLLNITV